MWSLNFCEKLLDFSQHSIQDKWARKLNFSKNNMNNPDAFLNQRHLYNLPRNHLNGLNWHQCVS